MIRHPRPGIYAWLVRLYPPEFRALFGEEMAAVFNAKLAAARREGWPAVLVTWLHELADLPGNLLNEYWLDFKKRSEWMTARRSSIIIGLGLPLMLVAALILLNFQFILKWFSSGLGWLSAAAFLLLVGLNGALIWRGQRQGSQPLGLISGLALAALLCALMGPALSMTADLLPAAWQTSISILLVLVIMGCLAGMALTLRAQRTG